MTGGCDGLVVGLDPPLTGGVSPLNDVTCDRRTSIGRWSCPGDMDRVTLDVADGWSAWSSWWVCNTSKIMISVIMLNRGLVLQFLLVEYP